MFAAQKQVHHGGSNFRMFQRLLTEALKVTDPSKWIKMSPDELEDLAWWSIFQNREQRGPLCSPKTIPTN